MAERKNMWTSLDPESSEVLEKICDGYKEFISTAKTERLCVDQSIEMAKAKGFRDLNEYIKENKVPAAGDKFYCQFMNKAIILGIFGEDDIQEGMNILGAHIDSPRLDLKQNPMYESDEMVFLDTHYYGGIKKYQWVTIPLALYGVVVKKDGKIINIAIGDNEDDPVFCISDLLVHLSANQMTKKASVVVEAEALDVLFAGRPIKEEDSENAKETVKENVLKILLEQYNIEEEDFLSAEIEVVPAGRARDLGIDRSMIIGYGQDDRVCAYTSLLAILDTEKPQRTSLCVLVDKEEIGSVGATGMQSRFFEDTVAEIINLYGNYSDIKLRRALRNSFMLSSDVSAAFDPNYSSVFEKKNAAFFGRGIVFNKYTGARGKSGSNDANPEYIAKLRKLLDDAKVGFQTAELGKVDEGGGGTIAYILANYGMNVIDSGIAVMSMHSPWEVTSKIDIYHGYRCYMEFLKNMK